MKVSLFTQGLIAAAIGSLASQPLALGQETPERSLYMRERAMYVEEVRNTNPGFAVHVAVDRADRTYQVGDLMTVRVRSQKAGHLYLLYLQADGKTALLFPNKFHPDGRIPANSDIQVPSADSSFRFRTGEPVGNEMLKAIVSETPLKGEEIDLARLKDFVEVPQSRARAMFVEEVKRQESGRWAEHNVEIKTLAKGAPTPQTGPRRLAVCIGISRYQSAGIPQLKVCHKDAVTMAETLKTAGNFSEVIVLTDEKATRAAIEQAIRKELASKTKPGDEIVIYWSGHGARIADDNGDEADGQDEVLVPYDTKEGTIEELRSTLIIDDQFGRWIQELDGRRVFVVLDTCHSGGQATQEKKLSTKSLNWIANNTKSPLSFGDDSKADAFDLEFARVKDIGQRGVSLLASSTARQPSLERLEGDLSVLTYFMLEHVKKSPRAVTPKTLFEDLSKTVPAYVQAREPGRQQTPVLIDDISPEFILRK